MPGKRKALKEKRRIEIKVDGYDEIALETIMNTGLWIYEQDAIKAAIHDLARRIREGEFSDTGRKL